MPSITPRPPNGNKGKWRRGGSRRRGMKGLMYRKRRRGSIIRILRIIRIETGRGRK